MSMNATELFFFKESNKAVLQVAKNNLKQYYNDNTIRPGFSVPQPMQNSALAGFSWPQGPVQPGP